MANKGEGSRGGKIIGHYKSGAPKYGAAADKKEKPNLVKRITKAVGYGAAGVGATAGVARVAGEVVRKSADVQNKAHDLERIAAKGINVARKSKVTKFAVQHRIVQKVLEEMHSKGRVGAAIIGTGLLYKAASSAIEGTSYDVEKNKVAAAGGAGVVAAFLTRGFENKALAHSSKVSWKVAASKFGKLIKK